MNLKKIPYLKEIKLFLEKKKEVLKNHLPDRESVDNLFSKVVDNTPLRIFTWFLLFFCIIAFVIGFRNHAISNPEYLKIQNFVFLFAFLVYIALIFPFHNFLSSKLYRLILPNGSNHDSETARNTVLLAIGIILCMTAMIFLLMFDYFEHSKGGFEIEKPQVTKIQNNLSGQPPSSTTQGPSSTETPVFLGTYGDFFGGIVNPVLTFGTLIALAITILMQRLQLRDARNENKANSLHAKEQAFESTFFNLLSLHTENVKNLRFDEHVSSDKKASEGRSVFASILAYLGRNTQYAFGRLAKYRSLQKKNNDILGHYFRHLYQILNHIENFKYGINFVENKKFKKRYANILRAQLSSHELVLLLLNCTEGTVDKGRFRYLVVKYEFLEHLPATEGEDGVPFVPELGLNAEKIFAGYFPNDIELRNNPHGAFGKNEVFKLYMEKRKAAETKPALE